MSQLLPGRNIMHRYTGEPEAFPCCNGRGGQWRLGQEPRTTRSRMLTDLAPVELPDIAANLRDPRLS